MKLQTGTTAYLKVCVLLYIICSHSVEDELCLIGHSHYVVSRGMGQQPETGISVCKLQWSF